jgi:hypothetical protein
MIKNCYPNQQCNARFVREPVFLEKCSQMREDLPAACHLAAFETGIKISVTSKPW